MEGRVCETKEKQLRAVLGQGPIPHQQIHTAIYLSYFADTLQGSCSCLVNKSYPTLWDLVGCSIAGFPVHHYLPEFAQTHVHWVSDAIQPSYPLSPPSPPALNIPRIRVFSNEWALRIRWPKYWNFSFSISASNEYSGLIFSRIDCVISLQSKGLSRVFSRTTVQKHQFFGAQTSLWSNSHLCTWLLEKP